MLYDYFIIIQKLQYNQYYQFDKGLNRAILMIKLVLIVISFLIVCVSGIQPIPKVIGLLASIKQLKNCQGSSNWINMFDKRTDKKLKNMYFDQYINSYLSLDCNFIKETNIVVDGNYFNIMSKQLIQFKNLKKPLYYHQIENKQTLFKLPLKSQAMTFYILDNQIQINCSKLQNYFEKWKKGAVENRGALIGKTPISANLYVNQNKFEYQGNPSQFYTSVAIGGSILSSEYMKIYNSHSIEVLEMVQYSKQVQNCQSLLMNFIVGKFYPHRIPKIFDKKQNQQHKIEKFVDKVIKDDYSYLIKQSCMRKFSQIQGQFPFFIALKSIQDIQASFFRFPDKLDNEIKLLADLNVEMLINQIQFNSKKHEINRFMLKLSQQQIQNGIKGIKNVIKSKQGSSLRLSKTNVLSMYLNAILLVFNCIGGTLICAQIWLGRKNKQQFTFDRYEL